MARRLSVDQDKLLGLLRELVEILNRNHIRYFVAGGTIIGSLRHKGFIPWDDDVDIIMLRSEWKKLIEVVHREGELPENRTIECIELNPNYNNMFGRYIDTTSTVLHYNQYLDFNSAAGYPIDIFVLDPIPDLGQSLEQYSQDAALYSDIVNPLLSYSYSMGVNQDRLDHYYERVKKEGRQTVLSEIERRLTQYGIDDCDYLVQAWGVAQLVFPKELLLPSRSAQFEDITINIPGRAYDYLVRQYGDDWLYIPPVSEQTTHNALYSPDINYQTVREDYAAQLDAKQTWDMLFRRKMFFFHNMDNLHREATLKAMLQSVYAHITTLKRIEDCGFDLRDALDRADYGTLEDIFDSYFLVQLSAELIGRESYLKVYRYRNPIYCDLGDDNLEVALLLLVNTNRIAKAARLLDVREHVKGELSPALNEIRTMIASIREPPSLYDLGETDLAVEKAEYLYHKYPRNFSVLVYYLGYLYNQGEFELLEQYAREAQHMFPNAGEFMKYLADCSYAKATTAKEKREAYRLYSEALRHTTHGLMRADVAGKLEHDREFLTVSIMEDLERIKALTDEVSTIAEPLLEAGNDHLRKLYDVEMRRYQRSVTRLYRCYRDELDSILAGEIPVDESSSEDLAIAKREPKLREVFPADVGRSIDYLRKHYAKRTANYIEDTPIDSEEIEGADELASDALDFGMWDIVQIERAYLVAHPGEIPDNPPAPYRNLSFWSDELLKKECQRKELVKEVLVETRFYRSYSDEPLFRKLNQDAYIASRFSRGIGERQMRVIRRFYLQEEKAAPYEETLRAAYAKNLCTEREIDLCVAIDGAEDYDELYELWTTGKALRDETAATASRQEVEDLSQFSPYVREEVERRAYRRTEAGRLTAYCEYAARLLGLSDPQDENPLLHRIIASVDLTAPEEQGDGPLEMDEVRGSSVDINTFPDETGDVPSEESPAQGEGNPEPLSGEGATVEATVVVGDSSAEDEELNIPAKGTVSQEGISAPEASERSGDVAEDGAPEFADELFSFGKQYDTQTARRKVVRLLRELDELCNQEGIDHWLGFTSSRFAYVFEENLPGSLVLDVLVPAGQMDKLADAILAQGRSDRALDCLRTNPYHTSFQMEYVDKTTTFLRTGKGYEHASQGIRVTILPIRKKLGKIKGTWQRALEMGWLLTDERRTPNTRKERIASGVIMAGTNLIGRERVAKYLQKSFTKAYAGMSRTVGIRLIGKKTFYCSSSHFEGCDMVLLDGYEFPAPCDGRRFLRKYFGKKWVEKTRRWKTRYKDAIIMPDMSYEEFLTQCAAAGVPFDEYCAVVRQNAEIAKDISAEQEAHANLTRIINRTKARMRYYNSLSRQDQRIRNLYERGNYAELKRIFRYYQRSANLYLKYDMGLCPSKEYADILCWIYRQEGNEEAAAKLEQLIPKEHYEPVGGRLN